MLCRCGYISFLLGVLHQHKIHFALHLAGTGRFVLILSLIGGRIRALRCLLRAELLRVVCRNALDFQREIVLGQTVLDRGRVH